LSRITLARLKGFNVRIIHSESFTRIWFISIVFFNIYFFSLLSLSQVRMMIARNCVKQNISYIMRAFKY